MKSFASKKAMLPLVACSLIALTGCQKERMAFTFVATSSTEWNTSVSIGDWTYKFKGNLQSGNKFVLSAITDGKAQTGGPGGPGGGFPGGGFPGGGFPAEETSETSQPTEEELRAQDFTIEGTWTHDVGYGYVLNLNDENKTVIHADYSKIEGRHSFYYTVTKGDKSSLVYFQAKDPTYRNRLAKDYQTWDKRDSKYILTAKATGNNSSVAYAYMYCHNDGSVVINAPKNMSPDRSVTFGNTWTENDRHVVSLISGDVTYPGVETINPAHPGYRISYNGLTFLYSFDENVKWSKLTIEDFDGTAIYKFAGEKSGFMSSTKIALNLYDEGVAKWYEGSNFDPKQTGTWVESNDKLITVTFGDKSYSTILTDTNDRQLVVVTETKLPWGETQISETVLSEVK